MMVILKWFVVLNVVEKKKKNYQYTKIDLHTELNNIQLNTSICYQEEYGEKRMVC